MYASEFSKSSLRSLIRKTDLFTYNVLREKHTKEHYLSKLAEQISEDRFTFDRLKSLRIGAFSAYQPTRLGDALVLRKLDSIVRKLYALRQSDRNSIVHQAQVLLSENSPKYVYKLDIQRFFESIDRDVLLDKLRDDSLISPTSLKLISIFFNRTKSHLKYGVPRGLAISSTLSELYLKGIDDTIPKMDGVYYYARYVDDMLIFSCRPLDKIVDTVNGLFQGCMRLNADKCREYIIGCECDPICGCETQLCKCAKQCACPAESPHEISYLGYKLIVPQRLPKPSVRVKVTVEMADKKINRIKTRIVKALLNHKAKSDGALLRRRIRFLTENHRVIASGSRGKLSSGVYFNYPLVSEGASLRSLDQFLRAQLFSSANKYGAAMSASLTMADKRQIASYSFVSGFVSKRSRSVKPVLLKQIRKCW